MLQIIFCLASLNFIAITNIDAQLNCESCAIPGATPQTYVTGAHAVIYAGSYFNEAECITYFFYCVVNDGGAGGSDISNSHFGDLDCNNTCLDNSSLSAMGSWSIDNNGNIVFNEACGTVEYGTDPNTNVCGIKHDEESEGGCYETENCGGEDYSVTHLYLAIEGTVAGSQSLSISHIL